jgi:hypothetical protein
MIQRALLFRLGPGIREKLRRLDEINTRYKALGCNVTDVFRDTSSGPDVRLTLQVEGGPEEAWAAEVDSIGAR